MDFTILDRSGMTKAEFAKLMRVSRVTVYKWAKGSNVRKSIEPRLKRALSLIGKAVKGGMLPLSDDVPREERLMKIVDVLKRYANPDYNG